MVSQASIERPNSEFETRRVQLSSRMPDRSRLDALYQYIVAVAAGSEDFRQRRLGGFTC